MIGSPLILAIESSCDDTAAAVLQHEKLLSSIVSSQLVHGGFGGVVPELASRAHQQLIVPVVNEALASAGRTLSDVDAVAVTYGPGLAGSLLVGLSYAKALAFGLDRPLVGVNHLEGHLYSVFLDEQHPPFPYLALVVSGGHTQLMMVEEGLVHSVLGKTRDDAAGEAFDKTAKLLGLSYPGGPQLDALAREGDPRFMVFPRARPGGFDFSFSGLKTAVLYYLNKFSDDQRAALLQEHLSDLCASVQDAIVTMLIDGLRAAIRATGIAHVAIVGGVSANTGLRRAASTLAEEEGVVLYIPPLAYCMDNAAMIAVAAEKKLFSGVTSPLTLNAEPDLAF